MRILKERKGARDCSTNRDSGWVRGRRPSRVFGVRWGGYNVRVVEGRSKPQSEWGWGS